MYRMYIAWSGKGRISEGGRCVCGDLHQSEHDASGCARKHGLQVRHVYVRVNESPAENADADADPKAEQCVRQGEAEAASAFGAYEQGLVSDPYSLIPD